MRKILYFFKCFISSSQRRKTALLETEMILWVSKKDRIWLAERLFLPKKDSGPRGKLFA